MTIRKSSKHRGLSRGTQLSLVLACVVWADGAVAQVEKEEIAVEAGASTRQVRKKVDAETKPHNLHIVEQQQPIKTVDEGIVRLKRLVDKAPATNPKRAELLFNLSELYWEKSRWYEQASFAKEDECYALKASGDEGEAKACEVSRAQLFEASQRLRNESVEHCGEIIKNYPDFAALDEVYYYLGANLLEVDKRQEAFQIFRRLVANYPQSKFVPNVLVVFGDDSFGRGDVANALRAYERVRKYPKSSVYGYARYKEAWSHFNLDAKEKALQTFLETLEIAQSNAANDSALAKQTRKDIVLTYSFFGSPDKAIPFFRTIAGSEWLEMAERLAVLYADHGNPADSTRLFRELIRLNKDKTIDYEAAILRNTKSSPSQE